MMIALTDKIAYFVKSYCNRILIATKELISLIFDIITIFGSIILMLITIISPNLFTFILSIILFFLFFKRDSQTLLSMSLIIVWVFINFK